jgi:putative transposase
VRPRAVGIDLGIKHLVTLSNGIAIDQHKSIAELWRKLDQHERHLGEQVSGSNRSKETARVIEATKRKIADAQKDHADKIAAVLCKRYKVICIEAINVGPHILINEPYKLAVERANWPQIVSSIKRKALQTNVRVVDVAPHYTSQTCSKCGERHKLELHERDYQCDKCGLNLDRDVNAALVIKEKGLARLSKQTAMNEGVF